MRALLFLALAAAAGTAQGQTNTLVVIGVPDTRTVDVRVIKPADYVSMPITIVGEAKDPEQRWQSEIDTAQALIDKSEKSHARVRVEPGPGMFTGKPAVTPGKDTKPAPQILLLCPIAQPYGDLASCSEELTRFYDRLTFAGKSRCLAGNVSLAVENPERYRGEILARIAEVANATRRQLGSRGKLIIAGLQNPVRIRRLDDRHVECYVDYNLTIELEP